ncbi:MAG: metallophosphoesterase [Dehalococcoidia bacterium]|nr:metallophosphoesterase [Dehalococcoidia bacterium]MDP6226293.1 metallophosphoesterase [Dehalococcoidia bacterium]MDP7083302.1 metallophosphoesterase [Dehalococcoidia bacterium]MDP7200672.1 metallophosphoesterase [Dehalococcoidia bacterium]MDP7509651.1 metallophosphoesterase [Dehalococcoidia bacterium]
MSPKKKIRLIHTSDTHLGDHLGHPVAEEAFQAVVDAVPALGGDILLLVGDVFDNHRVSDEVIEFFLEHVGRLAIPAVILPGNHDLYDDESIYLRQPFQHAPPNLHIFTQHDGETLSFPELTLDLWGRAMLIHAPEFRPLLGMPPNANGRWLVALAHCHFHEDHEVDQRSSPIYPEDVEGATCDYLALGHWDRYVDLSYGRVKASYSGTPLGPSPSNPVRAVNVVEMDPDAGIQFRQVSLAGWAGKKLV